MYNRGGVTEFVRSDNEHLNGTIQRITINIDPNSNTDFSSHAPRSNTGLNATNCTMWSPIAKNLSRILSQRGHANQSTDINEDRTKFTKM